MIRTIRVIGQILESAEHDRRMIRTNANHPDNKPYYVANRVGRFILRIVGDDRE